ncbi:MAG TPA: MFS transporter [Terriglobales bacterium]|jgi:ACS family hexuronate transporter-like MFS transporter|nr:MFS transporter [Terriglobales bacterium]
MKVPVKAPAAPPAGHYRWVICALLFFATTINYMDRQVIGILAPYLQRIIGWNDIQYGYIVTAFQAAYALGLLVMGGLIDRVGTRIGYAIAISVWSLSAMGHALANSVWGFVTARFMLGLGESGNFPAGIKTVAEWFPQKERAFATGLFNAGSNVGAVLAPLTVPWIYIHLGWRWAFLFTGFFSAGWLAAWLVIYRRPEQHPRLSPGELAYIQSDPAEPLGKISWKQLLPHRQTWAFAAAKFLTDPIWWFYLFWIPSFLHSKHGLTLTELSAPLVVIYVMADGGSIAGGWLSSRLLKRGWSVNRARKTAMAVCALAVVPIVSVSRVAQLWPAVLLIGLAAAAHQGWSCNLFTLASDMFPKRAVATVVGLGGFAGAVGGMLIAAAVGHILQWTHSYVMPFLIAGCAYLIALLVLHLLAPRLQAVQIDSAAQG